MGCQVMALPKPTLAELLEAVVLPSRAAHHEHTAEMAGRADQLLRNIVSVIDDLISPAIEKRTAEDFANAQVLIFPQYFSAMRALGDLSRIVIPKQMIDRLSSEWFCELEANFRDLGQRTFGADLAERGIFTAWILRKIHNLAQDLGNSASPVGQEAEESQMAMDFAAKAMWTRFHVDCLSKAMRDHKPIYPDVIEPIRDGLRAAVNTYASLRQWADMRMPRVDAELDMVEWTDDDELLLLDSMRDLEAT